MSESKMNDLTFEEKLDHGDQARFEVLMEQRFDFSGELHFPGWLREELSNGAPYKETVRDFLSRNSLICHEVGIGNPASDKICRVVYSDSFLGWGPIDDWISRGLGGRSLFNRLPKVSKLLVDHLTARAHNESESSRFNIKDLGAGSGSYAFKTLGVLRNQDFPVATIDWECIDLSEDAIAFGMQRMIDDGFSQSVRFTKENFMSSKLSQRNGSDQADLIILVGVLCGMTKEDAIKCLQKIRFYGKEGTQIIAATLLVQSYKEDPLVYQLLANLGWHLRPKTMDEVKEVFYKAGYKILSINSERMDAQGNEIPGEYAIVTATADM